MSTGAPATPPPQKSSGSKTCLTIFIGVMVVLLIIGTIVGVGAYWAYQKAKQKVAEIKTQVNQGISQATSEIPSGVTQEEPCPAGDTSAFDFEHATVPMKVGLTMMKIWSTNKGDLETLTQVQSVDNHSVNVTASSPDRNDPTKTLHGQRNICLADLQSGNLYVTSWGSSYPDTMRQVTMFSLSQSEFQALKEKGEVPFTYWDSATRVGNGYRLSSKAEGTLQRVEPNDVPVSVIVNEQKVDLPTIHAKGELSGHPAQLYVIDDPKNPIVLDYEMPDSKFQIKIMKITFPTETKAIEKQLETEGKAIVYGIYFDFNSSTIRPESEPVLKEIADALHDHPDWKLSVNGHTDNVGGNTYNQKLSVRRAESVKQALMERYQIAGDRLQTGGFGAGSPIDTNDTPEGRARNRRVELIKQ